MSESSKPRPWAVSFYSDAEAKHEIKTIELGEIWNGEVAAGIIFMRNDEPHDARQIIIIAQNPEITVEGPETMRPGEVAPLKVTWQPIPGGPISLRINLGLCATLVMREYRA